MTNSSLTTITAKPAPEETQSCWSCGTMRAVHFCEACGKVQPPAPVDYFTYFGLQRKLNLDVAALEKDFYQLSRKLHPDLNARAGSEEQEWSLQQSSLLNDAYRTLKDPVKRTQYLKNSRKPRPNKLAPADSSRSRLSHRICWKKFLS
jgi:hypothetical protein